MDGPRPGARPLLTAAVMAVWLVACASAPRRPATVSPPTVPTPPQAGVPDAVPRAEPRSAHGNPPFYDVNGRRYTILPSADNFVELVSRRFGMPEDLDQRIDSLLHLFLLPAKLPNGAIGDGRRRAHQCERKCQP